MDNGVVGVVTNLSISGLKAASPATPNYGADGFWATTDSYSASGVSYAISYKFKVWNAAGVEIITLADLQAVTGASDLSRLSTYTTIDYTYSGGSFSMSYGSSTSNPLIFNYDTATINGPITLTNSYSGTSYSITFTYADLASTVSGYPTGSVSWSMAEGSSTVASGTVTFNGTSTATVAFTSGYSGTYTVNLDTGLVSSTN
jgi:hypothetical protein